uniref:Class gamma glutathione S-transferase 2 n=1 Tax=Cunninghamella elegans TaxID=4853 RepID=Q96UI6_CUNEL|nr:class gamma glutathione S-transferase 2 [Cunninghamella elegans]
MALNNATLYYFDFSDFKPTVALGENLNLFLKDSGIDYEYIRVKGAEFKESDLRKKLLEQKYYSATLPAVEIDGKFYNKTAPTMRFLGKKLGKYVGKNDEENYFLDTAADLVRDYFQTWIKIIKETDEEKLKEHFENDTKKYLGIFNDIYGEHQGPYILGEEITYPDFLVYHLLDDDKALDHLADYPNLQQFVNTFTRRPNLVAYFTSLK